MRLAGSKIHPVIWSPPSGRLWRNVERRRMALKHDFLAADYRLWFWGFIPNSWGLRQFIYQKHLAESVFFTLWCEMGTSFHMLPFRLNMCEGQLYNLVFFLTWFSRTQPCQIEKRESSNYRGARAALIAFNEMSHFLCQPYLDTLVL